jgi:polysaccharide export outer membrane protein
MIKIFCVILLFSCYTYAGSAELTQKTLKKDMGYYYKTSKQKNLNINGRLFILYGLQKKYAGTNVNMTMVKNEISGLEPKRIKKMKASTDPVQDDLNYYRKTAEQTKLNVNDMLYILYTIRNKYEGVGADLTPIDDELSKLNPQWLGTQPVAHKTLSSKKDASGGQGLKPGDILGISIYPMERFSGEVIVKKNGTINLPLIGVIQVKGMTLEKLSEVTQEKLVRYVTNPLVTVIKHQFNKNKIFVAGEINSPGAYLYSGNLNIAGLISLAGGLTKDADETNMKLYRNKTLIKIKAKDFPVNANDIVEIPSAVKKISVLGEVKSPGDYNYYDGMTLKDAISNAKGNKKSAKLKSVKIFRKAGPSERTTYVENFVKVLKGKAKFDLKLEPSDIIFVPKK